MYCGRTPERDGERVVLPPPVGGPEAEVDGVQDEEVLQMMLSPCGILVCDARNANMYVRAMLEC